MKSNAASRLLTEMPKHVVVFAVRWKRRKGQPLQLVNHVEGLAVLNILATQQAIAEQCKVPMSWVEWVAYTRSSSSPRGREKRKESR